MTPTIIQAFIPERYILWRCKGLSKKVLLTFDDGPHAEFTPKILDVLNQLGVKATFFLVGKEAQKYQSIVKEIVKGGHTLGNHTYSHVPLTGLNLRELEKEIFDTQKFLCDLSGTEVKLFRPPWGKVDLKSLVYLLRRGFQIILWSIDSNDYKKDGEHTILRSINLVKKKEGEIILFHDDNEFTINALPKVIDTLRQKGFDFANLELI